MPVHAPERDGFKECARCNVSARDPSEAALVDALLEVPYERTVLGPASFRKPNFGKLGLVERATVNQLDRAPIAIHASVEVANDGAKLASSVGCLRSCQRRQKLEVAHFCRKP